MMFDFLNEKKKLKRKELIDATDEFFASVKEYEIFKIPDKMYMDYFEKIEKFLNNSLFKEDNRFITNGRLSFLRKELTLRLNDESLKEEDPNWKEKWDNRLGAFIDLSDFIRGDNFFPIGQIPKGTTFKKALEDSDNYYRDGYICKQEKEILISMIQEFKDYINKKDSEEENMNIFKKINDKYNVKPEDNQPQFVYGVPDYLKEIKKESNEDDKNTSDKSTEKYKTNPETKPQHIPGKNTKETKGTIVFVAFHGGYFGPSEYYYIEKVDKEYLFKYGYTNDGRHMFENSKELEVVSKTENEYNLFINKLKEFTKQWEEHYVDPSILDGTQWNVEITEENIKYGGSNDFPDNYYDVKEFINNSFKFSNNKYDVDPEENIPREVYGIPSPLKDKYDIIPKDNIPQKVYGIMNPNKIDELIPSKEQMERPDIKCQRILITIKNKNNSYSMQFNLWGDKNDTFGQRTELLFENVKEVFKPESRDSYTVLPVERFNMFLDSLKNIVQDWQDGYKGSNDIEWKLCIGTDDLVKFYSGKGAYPANWNEYIDFLSEYEKLFKRKKIIELEEANSDKGLATDVPFEDMVKIKNNYDPFFTKLVLDYFRVELNNTDVVSKKCLTDLSRYSDIYNEFVTYLVKRTYDIENPICIEGYTAKKIYELNPSFTASGVYCFLQWLREQPEVAKDVIKKGFVNKDAVPPTVIKNSELKRDDELAEKYLKEIADEVDAIMIEQNLLTVSEDGKKIPVLGSCHTRWGIEKSILKDRYNIDWLTPAERNPFIEYD